jgi:hypothetical protein
MHNLLALLSRLMLSLKAIVVVAAKIQNALYQVKPPEAGGQA